MRRKNPMDENEIKLLKITKFFIMYASSPLWDEDGHFMDDKTIKETYFKEYSCKCECFYLNESLEKKALTLNFDSRDLSGIRVIFDSEEEKNRFIMEQL